KQVRSPTDIAATTKSDHPAHAGSIFFGVMARLVSAIYVWLAEPLQERRKCPPQARARRRKVLRSHLTYARGSFLSVGEPLQATYAPPYSRGRVLSPQSKLFNCPCQRSIWGPIGCPQGDRTVKNAEVDR